MITLIELAAIAWLTALTPADQVTVARAIIAADSVPMAGVAACTIGARGVHPPDGTIVEVADTRWAIWRQPAVNHEGWALCAMRIGVGAELGA